MMGVPALFQPFLERQRAVILDGAQGTELERRGCDLSVSKLWSARLLAEDPDLVKAICADYLEAGADIITTFTYQASIEGFAEAGIGPERASQLLNVAVDVAHQARQEFWQRAVACSTAAPREREQQPGDGLSQPNRKQQHGEAAHREQVPEAGPGPGSAARAGAGARCRPLIAFSCGSYGGYLADGSEFRGEYADTVPLDRLMAFHKARLDAVRHRAEVDLLAFETVPCLAEARAIAALLEQEQYGKPAWISFSCRDEQHTCHGERFAEECVAELAACPHVCAVGVNCCSPKHLAVLLRDAHAMLLQRGGGTGTVRPAPLLLCYPNSGEQWDGAGRCWLAAPPEGVADPPRFAEAAREWVDACGARLVGGCCRTTPRHIAALRAALCGSSDDAATGVPAHHG